MFRSTAIAVLFFGVMPAAAHADSVMINQLSSDAVAAAPLTEAPRPENSLNSMDYQQTILSNPYANSLANMEAINAANARSTGGVALEGEGEPVAQHQENSMLEGQGKDTLTLILQEKSENSVKYRQSGKNNNVRIIQNGVVTKEETKDKGTDNTLTENPKK